MKTTLEGLRSEQETFELNLPRSYPDCLKRLNKPFHLPNKNGFWYKGAPIVVVRCFDSRYSASMYRLCGVMDAHMLLPFPKLLPAEAEEIVWQIAVKNELFRHHGYIITTRFHDEVFGYRYSFADGERRTLKVDKHKTLLPNIIPLGEDIIFFNLGLKRLNG